MPRSPTRWGHYLATVEAVAAGVALLLELELGAGDPQELRWLLAVHTVVLCAFSIRMLTRLASDWRSMLRPLPVLTVVAVAVALSGSVRIAAGLAILHDAWQLYAWLRRARLGGRVIAGIGTRPARSLVVSFLSMIAVGTILLSLPAAAADGQRVDLIDAWFTAVSATCVTGLVTLDTASAWSPFGKGVIFALFQLGGLGIMVISGAVALAFGEVLGARRGQQLRDVFDEADAERLRDLLWGVVFGTLGIETAGAILLFGRFVTQMPAGEAATQAVFHSVSAFCNAGFSLNSDSLAQWAADPWVCGIIVVLLSTGGFGFGVLVAIRYWITSRGRRRLPVHSRVVLVTSIALIWIGTLAFFFFEYDRSLAHLSLTQKLLAALFQSASTRTAGFNTVSLDALHPVTILFVVGLMFVGASPGSTGGGIKTTTFAIILLAARAFLLERQDVEVFGRRIHPAMVLRALAITGGAVVVYALGFGLLLTTEHLPFERLAFEAASAIGTVGLSMGVTGELSTPGRMTVALLMFLGRVGPLTAVAALSARRPPRVPVALPEGKILVG